MNRLAHHLREKPARHPRVPDEPEHRTPSRHREPSHQDIERRAYEIYQHRDGDDGSEVLDWLQAERELRGAAQDRAFEREDLV